jgi:5-methylcytosine-specific restriction endonuclease McrA
MMIFAGMIQKIESRKPNPENVKHQIFIMKCSNCKQEGHNKRSCTQVFETSEAHLKSQRKTKNLGLNTAKTQDESYAAIEAICATARCSDRHHEGERILPVRKFYLNKGGKKLQGACIRCQKNRRANRIKRSRAKFDGMTKQEVCDMYRKTYGPTKTCSKCKTPKSPIEFPISISMETGLHNHCITCSIGNSQGNGGIRDFIYMPDKDGIKYKKKETCERCGGTYKLAVDHILPIAKGGTDCIRNKQTLCIHCNSKKNDTIDCAVQLEFLSERYKDTLLDFTDNVTLTRILSKKVYEFRQTHIETASIEDIRNSVKDYATKHNLGHNLDRIVEKIAIIFNK